MRLATPAERAHLGPPTLGAVSTMCVDTPGKPATLYFQVVNGAWMCSGWTFTSGSEIAAHFPSPIAG